MVRFCDANRRNETVCKTEMEVSERNSVCVCVCVSQVGWVRPAVVSGTAPYRTVWAGLLSDRFYCKDSASLFCVTTLSYLWFNYWRCHWSAEWLGWLVTVSYKVRRKNWSWLTFGTILAFSRKDWGPSGIPVTLAALRANILTGDLPSAKQECQPLDDGVRLTSELFCSANCVQLMELCMLRDNVLNPLKPKLV
jgi:hypothetical protein